LGFNNSPIPLLTLRGVYKPLEQSSWTCIIGKHYCWIKEGGDMPYYVVLSSLTDKGRKTVKENPERIFEVNKEFEKMGIKVKEQYAVLGLYDFVSIIEAPDNAAVLKASIELGSRGSSHPLTLAAIPVSDFVKKRKKK
jgi:uncharacterized protein with GYD domain